jgi:thiamine-phosphate pyrophosphorylase
MEFHRNQLRLYGVTDRSWTKNKTLYAQVEDALKGGVTCIQLREKELPFADFLQEAKELLPLCHRYNVPLLINDNLEIALLSGADGVHVGQEDLPPAEIRKQAGKQLIVGVTAKTVEQAKMAEAQGADYLGVGAVFPSPTKTAALRITRELLSQICASVSIPAVAIGGIGFSNIEQLQGSGIAGVAVVSALFGAADIENAAKLLRQQAELL